MSLEKKFAQHSSIAFSLDYNFAKIQGGSTTSTSFPVIKRYLFANINWRPIRTKKQPFSWLVIGGGIGYYKKWWNYDSLVYSAPGIKNFIGVNYTIYDKFTTGFRTEFFYFYDFNQESSEEFLFDLHVVISVGYRFVKATQIEIIKTEL